MPANYKSMPINRTRREPIATARFCRGEFAPRTNPTFNAGSEH